MKELRLGVAMAGGAALAMAAGEALDGGLGRMRVPVEVVAPWVEDHVGWMLLAAFLVPSVVAMLLSLAVRDRDRAA